MSMIRIYYNSSTEKIPLARLDIHPELLALLQELGIVETAGDYMESRYVRRLYKIMRLRERLGINLNGAAVIVELLERIEALEEEVERLKTR